MELTHTKTKADKMYKEPVITYNHMQEEALHPVEGAETKGGLRNNLVVKFIAEELIIALLLALIFYMI